MKKILAFIIFSVLLCSCENLPEDLLKRKNQINLELDEINTLHNKAVSMADISEVIYRYKVLSDSIESYTTDCNKRGIEKDNTETLNEIKEKVNTLKEKRKELCKEDVIGTWSFSSHGISYQKQILRNGNWISQGLSGYGSGTWEGDCDEIIFFESGVQTHDGYVDGDNLYLSTPMGSMTLER